MNNHRFIKGIVAVSLLLLFAAVLYSCVPYTAADEDKYYIVDNDDNYPYKDHTTKNQAIDRVTNGIDNLLDHLNEDAIATQGYYIGADIVFNSYNNDTKEESAFILKLRANLFTRPYPEEPDPMSDEYPRQHDDPAYIADLAQYKADKALYNETIKKSDIVLEWYEGMTNTMLIGFYFDGVNQNMADAGNNLYLNLQGDKRLFKDFGDTVLFQQMIRLLTQFNLDTILSSATNDESGKDSAKSLNELLKLIITNNYKQVINGEEVSVFFDNVDLKALTSTVTDYLHNFFGPFEDKIDPLTNKYLGFKFSTLGNTSVSTMASDMQFFVMPMSYFGITSQGDKEIMTGTVIDLSGTSVVTNIIKTTDSAGNTTTTTDTDNVNFQTRVSFDYSLHISPDIVIDKSDYVLYEYGQYEFVGELFIPNNEQKEYELRLNALIRTDVNETDNSKNRVFAEFRDRANDDLIIGMYYCDEPYIIKDQLTYIDIEGLQHLYGGIKFEDLNLPKAYKGGFDLSKLLAFVSDTIDYYIVAMVDELLSPSEDSSYDNLTRVIMSKMESTMKTKDKPESRNTISITIDMDLLRQILRETNPTGGSYDNDQLIATVNEMFGIDLEAMASILGYDVKEIIEDTWIKVTYDVDEYSISVKVYKRNENLQSSSSTYSRSDLIMQLDLKPTKIGRKVKIVFPDFKEFKPLKKVMTYSGYVEGQVIFAMTEEVDLSQLMGTMIGDLNGLNTPYILPNTADVHFRMYYDQYIREQILSNGRWTRTGRSAFDVLFYAIENDVRTDLFHIYANDVSFSTSSPIEELGYVWVHLLCIPDIPKMKIREDYFLRYFYQYMGYDLTDEDEITVGFTDIIKALMEDSYVVFEPDVIRVTTSNDFIKNLFHVDELIGTIAVQVGFVQRVKNIDELENLFAMYTVGELENITGTSPYTVKLHDSVVVYFDFGTRIETRNMKFAYDPDSIAVSNNKQYYYPAFDGLFMGVSRSYMVTIIGVDDALRSEITGLVSGTETWEPLPVRELPDKVRAYYGTSTYAYMYQDQVLYSFVGYYDRNIDYYIIPNEYGYEILYDAKNDVFVVDLGTNFKYDKLFMVIDESETVYLKKVTTDDGVVMLYDIGSHYAGYYVVQNIGMSVLYYYPGGVEMIKKRADIINENTKTVTQFLRREGFYLVETPAEIAAAQAYINDGGLFMAINMTKRFQLSGGNYTDATLRYDMGSGYFVVTALVNKNGENVLPNYTVLYSPVGGSLLYTSENISLQDGVDPERNETKLVKQDFILFNPTENTTISPSNTIQYVIASRKSQLLNLFGFTATSYYHVTAGLRQEYYWHYDMKNGLYEYEVTSGSYKYTVVYDGSKYYVNKDASLASAAAQILGVDTVLVDRGTYVNWDTVGRKNNTWEDVQKSVPSLTRVDWNNRQWTNIVWGEMPIEVDGNGYFYSPLTGGFFLVKVSIGEGRMATFEQYIIVQILNRTVDTSSYVNVTVDVAANASAFPFDDSTVSPTKKVIAPVINENAAVEIDPYAYVFLKADYVKNGFVAANFVTWLFQKYTVSIRFTTIFNDNRDTAPAVGKYAWYFDDTRGSQIYFREQDISNRVGEGTTETTYLYTVFQGQVIAMKLEIVPRTIDFLKFENERYDGTYTVDAIVEDTYTIPQNPVIYFKEKDQNGNPYTLDLSDFHYGASTIFSSFYRNFGVSVTNASLRSPISQLTGFINWTYPQANNVALINVQGTRNLGDINGNGVLEYPYEIRDYVKPFAGSTSDVDSSFFDIQGYVDPNAAWFTTGWFTSEVVTVIVLMPNKKVEEISYNVDGWGEYVVSDIGVQSGTQNGLYLLDPYDTSTWTLPSAIRVRFVNNEDEYYTMSYPVQWDEDQNVFRDSNGNFAFRHVDVDENYFVVSTRIGNINLGYIELRLLVRNLSGHIENYEFLGQNRVLAGSLEEAPGYSYGGENLYTYDVDTYARFEIPSSIRILFSDGTVRSYSLRWAANPPWIAGHNIALDAYIGSAQTARIPLLYRIRALTVNAITFDNHDDLIETLNINVSGRVINVSGVTISGGLINGRTPYEYLYYLLSSISLSFDETGEVIKVTDAALSVEDTIFRNFDTQKMITPQGQSFVIHLGQGAGADDCTVVFKMTGAKVITGYTVVTDTEQPGNYPMYDFRIYNDDNQMDYPNGFVIGDELTILVHYSDGTSASFGPDTIPLVRWVISKPDDFTVDGVPVNESAVTMLGIEEGDVLTTIPAVVLEDGGIAWVSAMLPDGSRIYVRLMAVCPTITNNYSSDMYVGDYAITNGTITITDYYKIYPIAANLTVDKLPTSIRVHNAGEGLAGGIVVDNIVWTFVNGISAQLAQITYTGCERFLLATAYIWGNKVELYMEVKDCTVTSISYDAADDDSKDFYGNISIEEGLITVYFDAYHNKGYNGRFALPSNLTIHFAGGGQHTLSAANYYFRSNQLRVTGFTYDYQGYTLDNFATILNRAELRVSMPDTQNVSFNVIFYDKTIEKIFVYKDGEVPGTDPSTAGLYEIDPYGEIAVPSKARIFFAEGAPLDIVPVWTYPANYEVKYDTYRRVLAGGAGFFGLTSSLTSAGISSQPLSLEVYIKDRVIEMWRLMSDETIVDYSELYSGQPGVVAANPNSYHLFDDIFAGRVSQLPQKLTYTFETNSDLLALNIVWDLPAGRDIIKSDVLILDQYNRYGTVYTGYLKNKEVGQPFTIRVFVSRWDYLGIRRLQGGVYQPMEEVRFFFSDLTKRSSEETYEVAFRKTTPSVNSPSYVGTDIKIIFRPEDRLPEDSLYEYVILWDNNAKQSAINDVYPPPKGYFVLANAERTEKIKNYDAYYQVEKTRITQLDFGNGFGVANKAIYVANPFDFYYGMTEVPGTDYYTVIAQAKGDKERVPDTLLGPVTVRFRRSDFSSPAALSAYVKGGIYAGYTVEVVYTENVNDINFTLTQEFNIMLVFLDMSPVQILQTTTEMIASPTFTLEHTLTSDVKYNYTEDSYSGAAYNPYFESYGEVMNALNLAAQRFFYTAGSPDADKYTFVYTITWPLTQSELKAMTFTQDTTIYSTSITVNGRTYSSNCAKLFIDYIES
jgi:hypothetical protein